MLIDARKSFVALLGLQLIISACSSKNVTESPDSTYPPSTYPPFDIVPPSAYGGPSWHPSGQLIAFDHMPIKEITYPYGENGPGEYTFDTDNYGFWIINPNGNNMQSIHSEFLRTPAWSKNGEWIAFVKYRQIHKIFFVGTHLDTSTTTQLTYESSNFFPAWSPDGEWIAYDNISGVFVMSKNGTENKFVANGRMPSWSPDGNYLVYIGLRQEIFRARVSSPSEIVRLTSFNQVDPYSHDNHHPKYSPNGIKIAFVSNGELWLMDSDGGGARSLTSEGIWDPWGSYYSWSPDGTRIVYVRWRADDWTYDNGVLWIVEIANGIKQQLTFNPTP